mmetsp:Transcript_13279/g.15387  ORF Transcript_13279/g.15387 Transcript_13279/m.15387 type:complete len:117 (+) Transcript_13279:938-1288(+)
MPPVGSLNTMQPNIGRVHEQESEQEAESIKIDQDEHVNHEFLSEESKNQYEIEECKDPARSNLYDADSPIRFKAASKRQELLHNDTGGINMKQPIDLNIDSDHDDDIGHLQDLIEK